MSAFEKGGPPGGAYQPFDLLQSGRARSWDDNQYGEFGNDNTGTDSDVPVAVKNLWDLKNIDGGYESALAGPL